MREGAAVLVAQHFLPLNAVSSQRALRMARTLLKRYERLYLVCGDPRDLDEAFLDRQYGQDVLRDPRLVRLDAPAILRGYGYGVKPVAWQRLIGAVATRAFCGPGIDWIPGVARALARVPAPERVRIAVVTGPPFATFGAVASWARARGVPIVLDYRDLWTTNPHARYPRLARALVHRLMESRVNRRASLLTTVSDGCRAMLARGGAPNVRVVYNSPDREYVDAYRRLVEEGASPTGSATPGPGGLERPDRAAARIRVVYTGLLYPGCTCAPIVAALAAMPASRRVRIEVHYYGGSSALARREFQEAGLSDRLVDHGQVPKETALRAVIAADLLLSLIHTDREAASPAVSGLMTTKLYDYLLSGNPILNVGPVNAEAVGFAARVGYRAFHTFTADDVAGIRACLERVLTDAVAMKVPPLSVPLPDFETEWSRAVDDAVAPAGSGAFG